MLRALRIKEDTLDINRFIRNTLLAYLVKDRRSINVTTTNQILKKAGNNEKSP